MDLSNQPIAGIPFMLYQGEQEENDCIFSSISNSAGTFQMPKPEANIYHFVTIIDKQKYSLHPFRILTGTHIVQLKFMYSTTGQALTKTDVPGEGDGKKTPISGNTTSPSTNPNLPPQPALGTIEGEILVDNQIPPGGFSFKLEGEHIEKKSPVTYTVHVTDGKYKIQGVTPGPYRFNATANEYNPLNGLQIFVLADQANKLSISFQRKVEAPKGCADISITVIDAGWTPQAGAQVIIQQKDGDYQRMEHTDPNGEVIFNNVPPGEYQIRASFNGIKGQCELEEQLTAVPSKFVSLVLREAE